MSAGYDPFRWADAFESEEEYIKELIKENEENAGTNNNNRELNRMREYK